MNELKGKDKTIILMSYTIRKNFVSLYFKNKTLENQII